MKFKLDENFGQRCVEVLTAAGHQVATVAGERMSGAADADVPWSNSLRSVRIHNHSDLVNMVSSAAAACSRPEVDALPPHAEQRDLK